MLVFQSHLCYLLLHSLFFSLQILNLFLHVSSNDQSTCIWTVIFMNAGYTFLTNTWQKYSINIKYKYSVTVFWNSQASEKAYYSKCREMWLCTVPNHVCALNTTVWFILKFLQLKYYNNIILFYKEILPLSISILQFVNLWLAKLAD